MQFPPTPAHSVSDGFSDSGISEMFEQTGMGPNSQPLATRRHGHRKHTKGRDTRFTSKPVRTDSGYESDRTIRRAQRTEVPAPRPQESEDESFGGSSNVSVASSDISSVHTTGSDSGELEASWKAGYEAGHSVGHAEGKAEANGKEYNKGYHVGYEAGKRESKDEAVLKAYEFGREEGFKEVAWRANDPAVFHDQRRTRGANLYQ